MTSPIDLVLERMDARETGRDRWRAACPVCGGRNSSTLSIGVGDNGSVLLHCFKDGCDAEQIAGALGLELSELFPPRESSAPSLKPRRLLTAQQALDLLKAEALVLFVVGSDMAANRTITETDWTRLKLAVDRIQQLGAAVYA